MLKSLFSPSPFQPKTGIYPFTKDMEMAAIVYLAEKDRKKGEGRVLKKTEEKIALHSRNLLSNMVGSVEGKSTHF